MGYDYQELSINKISGKRSKLKMSENNFQTNGSENMTAGRVDDSDSDDDDDSM